GADAMWSAVSDIECGSAGGSVEGGELTSEQLWGSMRVDSYFAPRLLPPTRVAMRLAALNIYLHNDMPTLNEENCRTLEGLYVSRPLRRSHRVLALCARDAA
ncbi:PREDICTED: uncharacterized protein LOC106106079, partial [Papilio polytes]|uniref:uncharacterized protein LOC106106079 n=1 Tax=Papilio polytes TaxID=76194 RepID=UPI000676A2DA